MTYAPSHVLGIDQASTSGWAIAVIAVQPIAGQVVQHGVAKDHAGRVRALDEALKHVQGCIDDLLIVFEDHSGFSMAYGSNRSADGRHQAPTRNAAAILGLGEAKGWWVSLLEGLGHPASLRLKVSPQDWRARVLGCSQSIGTDALKERALRWAKAHVRHGLVDHNEAEGICIAAWGSCDGMSVLQHGRREKRVAAREQRAESKQMPLWGAR
jgi:hypothetical protein